MQQSAEAKCLPFYKECIAEKQSLLKSPNTNALRTLANKFRDIGGFKDADTIATELEFQANEFEVSYYKDKVAKVKEQLNNCETVENCQQIERNIVDIINELNKISDLDGIKDLSDECAVLKNNAKYQTIYNVACRAMRKLKEKLDIAMTDKERYAKLVADEKSWFPQNCLMFGATANTFQEIAHFYDSQELSDECRKLSRQCGWALYKSCFHCGHKLSFFGKCKCCKQRQPYITEQEIKKNKEDDKIWGNSAIKYSIDKLYNHSIQQEVQKANAANVSLEEQIQTMREWEKHSIRSECLGIIQMLYGKDPYGCYPEMK
ncbi:hypothetical protein MK137Hg11_000032000 [Dysgonomonas reticulitermitis]